MTIKDKSKRGRLLDELSQRLGGCLLDEQIAAYRELREYGEGLLGCATSRKELFDKKICEIIDSILPQ